MPKSVRLSHEYCFFLHDAWVQMLIEYERADAHTVKIPFRNKTEEKKFRKIAKSQNTIEALRAIDRHDEAKRVILNQITCAMVSDCTHHVYEALCCLEKRKFIPAINLLRKPLLDTLTYLAWIVSDEDGFYSAFASGKAEKLSQRQMGNHRIQIFKKAISSTKLDAMLDADAVVASLFDVKDEYGLYGLFQHAVHLVTTERIEIRTSPENFNFIFKNPLDDDIYVRLYETLPGVLLLLSHVILDLFDRVKPVENGAKEAFVFRSTGGFRLLADENAEVITRVMHEEFSAQMNCANCERPFKFTKHNSARALLTDTYRCTACRHVSWLPLSWMF